MLDHSILADHKSNSVGKQAREIEDAVSLGGRLFGVAEEREGGADFGGEHPVRLRLVDAYSEHLRVGRRELGNISLIRLEFFRSTWRACLDVKGQDDGLLPPEVAEPYRFAILVL